MRRRQRVRGRSSGELEYILSNANFRANLTNGISCFRGHGVPVFVRATTAWDFDNEGKMIAVPSGAARFSGARMVYNRVVGKSQEFNTSDWTKSSFTTPDANTLLSAAVTAEHSILMAGTKPTTAIGESWLFTFRVEYTNHDVVQLIPSSLSFGSIYANYDLVNGTVSASGCTGTITPVSPGVWDISLLATATLVAAGGHAVLLIVDGMGAARYATFAGDGVKSLKVHYAQFENVSGQADQSVSEYVSVGADRKNWLTYTDDFSNGVWGKTNVTVTPDQFANPINGVVDAIKVEATATAATSFSQVSATGSGSVDGMTFRVYLHGGITPTAMAKVTLRNATSATTIISGDINYSTGVFTYSSGSSGVTTEDVGNGWWKIIVSSPTGFSNGDQVQVYLGSSGSSQTAGEYCYAYAPQLVRGVSIPSEYSAVGAAWNPHDSGVDGVKWFATNKDGSDIPSTTLRGYRHEGSRTNNIVPSRDLRVGSSSSGTLRWGVPANSGAAELVTNGDLGTGTTTGWTASQSTLSVVAGALRVTIQTNSLAAYGRQTLTTEAGKTYTATVTRVGATAAASSYFYVGSTSSSNDLGAVLFTTNTTLSVTFVATSTTTYINCLTGASGAVAGEYVDWDNITVKESQIQVDKSATGIDNVPNSASGLTAAVANGTILQTITTSGARSSSAYVKRRTGAGTIEFTRNGGTNWTNITSLINSSTWTRVVIENTSVTNPAIGFRIVTAGDAIEVDNVQDEGWAFVSSPIVTTTASVTRNTDALYFENTGNLSETAGTLSHWSQIDSVGNSGTIYQIGLNGAVASAPAYKGNAGTQALSSDGTTPVGSVAWATNLVRHKAAGTWDTGERKVVLDGGTVHTSASYDGSFNSTAIYVGYNGANNAFCNVRNVVIFNRALPNADIQAVTA